MATPTAAPTEREIKNAKRSGDIAAEGMVLLQNDGILPFSEEIRDIALFGSGARRTLIGGTGSGEVNVRNRISVEKGLEDEGYSVVSKDWLDEYDAAMDSARKVYEDGIRSHTAEGPAKALLTMLGNPFQEPEFRALRPEEPENLPADAAVYVLSRNAGEGADRTTAPGDFCLTDNEISDITLLAKSYPRFVLLLNVCGPVDLTPLEKITAPMAVLHISMGGNETGRAAAELLSGKKTPSGKLSTTWPKSYEQVPFSDDFAGLNGDVEESRYKEGIFVGYRYYDTFGIEPRYPFGYGLSYTTFRLIDPSLSLNGTEAVLSVAVQNSGTVYSGKEVVQVYASVPGDLDQPKKRLVAYRKTRELSPGETEQLSLSFPLERLSSYREDDAAWELEAGDYILSVGASSVHTEDTAVLRADEKIVLEQCANLLRGNEVGELRSLPDPEAADLPSLTVDPSAFETEVHAYDTPFVLPEEQNVLGTFTDEELTTFCVGASRFNPKDALAIGVAADSLPGAAGETTSAFSERGIPTALMADGPAGIRVNPTVYETADGSYRKNPADDPIFRLILPEELQQVDLSDTVKKYQYCTAIPTATLLAQTWDPDAVEQAGAIVAEEMQALGIHIWLAPGINIQRNPLGGRNYEYYSEDPVLAGLTAAAMVRSIQSHPGCTVSVKHFAANSQETNRNFNNSIVSERTLREIYLKPFEICVKESEPLTVMTALNLINGIHAANDGDLLTKVLREEWGYQGLVMTDWGTTSEFTSSEGHKFGVSDSAGCIKAGNDLIMPGSQHDVDDIRKALEDGTLCREDLLRCASHNLTVLNRLILEDI